MPPNVSAVTIPAGQTVQIAPADPTRTYLRFFNSTLSDVTYSISQAAASTFKGARNTGGQPDFVIDDDAGSGLVQGAWWCFNNSTVAAIVSIIQGYRD